MTQDVTLPVPLVPAEVDLRDFGFMPLHVSRLRDSDLAALATGDEFRAAVLLWCYSWHQVPAGSLPNDDRVLALRSGAAANSSASRRAAAAIRSRSLTQESILDLSARSASANRSAGPRNRSFAGSPRMAPQATTNYTPPIALLY